MGSNPDTPEPPAVTVARDGIVAYNKRVSAYVVAIFGATGAMVGVGAVSDNSPAFWGMFVLIMIVTFAGIPMLREEEHRKDRHTIRTWEARGLSDEFARFAQDAGPEVAEDPRMVAAAGMAERIRALQASDPSTDAMVTRLEKRLGRLITDEAAANAAVGALEAAGAGAAGPERLAAAAQRLEEEIARILTGMSELYTALLEAESGASADATAGLGELMAWLGAEAEIARAAQEAEAMRPADESAATARAGEKQ